MVVELDREPDVEDLRCAVKPIGTTVKKASKKLVETCNFIFVWCDIGRVRLAC
jgi:hypothetical protein